MTLAKFLKLHKNGEAQNNVSIIYNGEHIFKEERQKKIRKSDKFKNIYMKKVVSFSAITVFDGGGAYDSSVELIIHVGDENKDLREGAGMMK